MSTTHDDLDAILEAQISRHRAQDRRPLYAVLGFILSLLPTYLFQALSELDLSNPVSLVFLLSVIGATTYSFTFTYQKFFESQWAILQGQAQTAAAAKAPKGKTAAATPVDKSQEAFKAAMGYTLFFVNLVFLALVLFFHVYLLRAFEPHINFALSMLLPAGALFWLAQQNARTVAKGGRGKKNRRE
jgi:hypothetical protein